MKFTKSDAPNGNVIFTLELTPEDVKIKLTYITQMILKEGLTTKKTSDMLSGLSAMVLEIEEAQGVFHPSVKHP